MFRIQVPGLYLQQDKQIFTNFTIMVQKFKQFLKINSKKSANDGGLKIECKATKTVMIKSMIGFGNQSLFIFLLIFPFQVHR